MTARLTIDKIDTVRELCLILQNHSNWSNLSRTEWTTGTIPFVLHCSIGIFRDHCSEAYDKSHMLKITSQTLQKQVVGLRDRGVFLLRKCHIFEFREQCQNLEPIWNKQHHRKVLLSLVLFERSAR